MVDYGEDFVLIKRTTAKKNLNDEERNSYIEAAEKAAKSIITKSYTKANACVTPQVETSVAPVIKGVFQYSTKRNHKRTI